MTLCYVHSSSLGYGRLGVHLARELERKGIDLYDHLPGSTDFGAQQLMEKGARSKTCNLVCWVSVPSHARGWWEGQHAAIYTMWEATRLPESFRENLASFDTVLVPSHHNVELFSQYHDNVKLVLCGIDPEVWNFTPRDPPENEFRFLIAGSGPRKGTDLAYRAFNKVFRTWNGPTPKLIMKTPKPEDYYGERIEIVPGRISPEAEVDLYASAHCYIGPSRGEGFGLQPLQAIAQGLPTILTNAHGHESYAHLGYGLSTTLAPAAYFSHGYAGEWWEPDFDELCEYMSHVYLNYSEAQARAEISAKEVAENWTWERTAEQFIGHLGDQMTPYAGTNVWKDCELRLFHVRVQEPWAAEFAGMHYRFEANRDYWETADLKRHLYDMGRLDPSCLTQTLPDGTEVADMGLNEMQLARLGEYSASHAYCPTCFQKLNSQPTRADEIYAGMT